MEALMGHAPLGHYRQQVHVVVLVSADVSLLEANKVSRCHLHTSWSRQLHVTPSSASNTEWSDSEAVLKVYSVAERGRVSCLVSINSTDSTKWLCTFVAVEVGQYLQRRAAGEPRLMRVVDPSLTRSLVTLDINGVNRSDGVHSSPACRVRLVDGFVSYFDSDGLARFPKPKLEVTHVDACCRRRSLGASMFSVAAYRRARGASARSASLEMPLDDALWWNDVCQAHALPPSVLRPVALSHSDSGSVVHPLWSVGVHESLAVTHASISNFVRAVHPNPSAVVMHVSASWKYLTRLDVAHLKKLNAIHSVRDRYDILGAISVLNGTSDTALFVNPVRYVTASDRLLHVLLMGARYVADYHPDVRWTHVLMGHSNEMFVKSGLVPFLASHDMSHPVAGNSRSNIMSTISGQMTVGEFQDSEETPLRENAPLYYWGRDQGCDIREDFNIAALLRDMYSETQADTIHQLMPSPCISSAKYAANRGDVEGLFFNRTIALLLDAVLQAYFNEIEDCVMCMTIRSEALISNIFQTACSGGGGTSPASNASLAQQLRRMAEGSSCGERYSTMLWQNADWTATVEDVVQAMATPFDPPFALKRVRRNPTDAVRSFIEAHFTP